MAVEDAPWRSEVATRARPASESIILQTSRCALQDRERNQVPATTDAAASQEEGETGAAVGPPTSPGSPGPEEDHQDKASSPAEKRHPSQKSGAAPAPGRRRRRRRPNRRGPPSRSPGLLPGQQSTEEPIKRGPQRVTAIREHILPVS
ncbi:uncharacterized protein [Anabrus simplex]|uniref:uncharacterized protein isoform X2 n=1 Tax=Anabrus simplex TaxID=316456 RepID=UPI0035A26226